MRLDPVLETQTMLDCNNNDNNNMNNNNNNINKNNDASLCAKNFQLQGGRSIAVTTIEVATVIN